MESGPKARIVAAARELFLAEGYVAVTTERLAGAANVSKTSIYKYYGDMAGVLRAVSEAEADRFRADPGRPPKSAAEFREALVAFGRDLLEKILSPDAVRFDQLVYEQSRTHPDIADIYFHALILRTQRHLEDLLGIGIDRRYITSHTDPQRLADHLLSMWQGTASVRTRLGLTNRPYPNIEAWSRQCVDALLGTDTHTAGRPRFSP